MTPVTTARTPTRGTGASRASGARRSTSRPARGRSGRSGGSARAALRPRFSRRLVIGIAVVLAILLVGWLLWFSSLFSVRTVSVSGSETVSTAQVEEALAIPAGSPLLTIDTDELEQRVEAIPAVRDAEVSRSWPSTIEVSITDRTPVATVSVDGAPWLIDDTGTPYVNAVGLPADAVEGLIEMDLATPGSDDLATTEAIAVLTALPDEIRDQLESISAPGPAEVTLHLDDGRTVIWGDSSEQADKVTMLPGVLEHSGTVFDISSPHAIVIS